MRCFFVHRACCFSFPRKRFAHQQKRNGFYRVKRLPGLLPPAARFLASPFICNQLPKKTKRMKRWMFGAGLCLTVLAACTKDDDDKAVNDTDRNYVVMASMSNNAEIAAGQVAATKATNAMVKTYGQQMVSEHTPAQADLKSRVSALSLTAPDTVDAEHKALMVKLNSLSGYSFDTAYMNSQVKDHAKTVDIFNTEINGGNNTSIRGFAIDNLPHIQMHYNKADSLRKAL